MTDFSPHGQRSGRPSLRRRAQKVSRPTRAKSRHLSIQCHHRFTHTNQRRPAGEVVAGQLDCKYPLWIGVSDESDTYLRGDYGCGSS